MRPIRAAGSHRWVLATALSLSAQRPVHGTGHNLVERSLEDDLKLVRISYPSEAVGDPQCVVTPLDSRSAREQSLRTQFGRQHKIAALIPVAQTRREREPARR